MLPLLLAFLASCGEDRQSPPPIPDLAAILSPGAPQAPPAAPLPFTIEVHPQSELAGICAANGMDPPYRYKKWVPDAVYLKAAKILMLSDYPKTGEPCEIIDYGSIIVRWRERDLVALAIPLPSGTVPVVVTSDDTTSDDEDDLELLSELYAMGGYQLLAVPSADDEVPVKFPAPRPIVRRPDDAVRDLVARFGWQA